MEQLNLKDIVDLGMTAILLYINRDLWMRLNALQDKLFMYLEEGRLFRDRHNEEVMELTRQVKALEDNRNTP